MIIQKLEQVWTGMHAWPDYLQAMRALLADFSPKSQTGNQLLAKWTSLPGLCCQAANGQADWADEMAVAWMVFFGAANIMDTIQDGDPPDPAWAKFTPGMILNAASGMYFSASVLLNQMKNRDHLREVADEIIAAFYQGFLTMCSGQHQDLATNRPTIEEYWEIAANKSGTFFGLACRLGAHLATQDPQRLNGFHNYGVQLGLMIQVLDDIDDIHKSSSLKNWAKLYKSLPIVYCLHKGRPQARARLEALLQRGNTNPEAGEELMDVIDESGAVQFLLDEFESQRMKAVFALSQARPVAEYEQDLIAFLPKIHKQGS
jgi:geranylgeranyl pyrophosphate synthase